MEFIAYRILHRVFIQDRLYTPTICLYEFLLTTADPYQQSHCRSKYNNDIYKYSVTETHYCQFCVENSPITIFLRLNLN